MKFLILIIIFLLIFFWWFFLWKKSLNIWEWNVSWTKDISSLSWSISTQKNKIEKNMNLSKQELSAMCSEYVKAWDSTDLIKYNKGSIVTLIDNLKDAFPTEGSDMYKLYNTDEKDRINTLKWAIKKMDPNSMWYATLSDLLNWTNLCESYPDKQQCMDQLESFKFFITNKIVSKKELSLENPVKITLYSLQNNLSKDAYLKLIQELSVDYCLSK